MSPKVVVIARCKRRARPPRYGETEEVTSVCRGCLTDVLASLGLADQAAERAVHAVLDMAADGVVDPASLLADLEESCGAPGMIRRLRTLLRRLWERYRSSSSPREDT
ncbi:hypothetical protein SAMN05216215_101875 [Saccharopolyspora shandongensis]|uniref:Uncharacterized protein n=1 Tax=Saccharopolyspora shandongensis TaxID=418495 RepID=A0A1H3GA27_9PSEU|nr:hypothetical protein [Saccharopolyspora shandongensis]SDX99179.1 hypothetical protein SAMN05216215_101875 [Saccharopolyspora shandongensis]